MKQRLRFAAALFLMIGVGVGCQTTPNPAPTHPIHMLRLLCKDTPQKSFKSRIAVLDVGDPMYDYGFATGHAVPPQRPCSVKDFMGDTQSVNMIRLADGYQSGEDTDWAIIRFDKMSSPNLVRYKFEPFEGLGSLQGKQFYFAQARGLSENSLPCKLSILDFRYGRRRVTHDCKAIPGQSGSPITYIVEGEHRLVGLHIGSLWMHQSPETNRPDRKGYINLLDQETIDQITRVISESRD